MTTCLGRFPLLQPQDSGFQSQAKPVVRYAGAALSCCLSNVLARCNVGTCADPAFGCFPAGGDGKLGNLLVTLVCLIFWLSVPEEVEHSKDGWMPAPLQTEGTAAPRCFHYPVPSLKCSRGLSPNSALQESKCTVKGRTLPMELFYFMPKVTARNVEQEKPWLNSGV